MEVRGKSVRGIRKVFLLLTEAMVSSLQYLLKTRTTAGIVASNPYVFARRHTDTMIDGCTAVRTVVSGIEDKLENPKTLRSRSLRKYLATISQVR